MKKTSLLTTLVGILTLTSSCISAKPVTKSGPATASQSAPSISNQPKAGDEPSQFKQEFLTDFCQREMLEFPGPYEKEGLGEACKQVKILPTCESANGDPIFHYDKVGKDGDKSKKVFVISMIHGDEIPAGSVTRAWMTRLQRIEPRNSWRVIPMASPDGIKARTRVNANQVDLDRNFPSENWEVEALQRWRTQGRSDPRRYPGPSPASEIETRCLIKHLNDYKPDFVISVHTPLGVLDFDGPQVKNPNFAPLPWVSLGNFPGSLGRFMWVDRKIPVLTIELKGNDGLRKLEQFDQLQDITGTIAIQADKLIKKDSTAQKAPVEKK